MQKGGNVTKIVKIKTKRNEWKNIEYKCIFALLGCKVRKRYIIAPNGAPWRWKFKTSLLSYVGLNCHRHPLRMAMQFGGCQAECSHKYVNVRCFRRCQLQLWSPTKWLHFSSSHRVPLKRH